MANDQVRFGEVYYYFRCKIRAQISTLVVLSVYSDPDSILYKESLGTVVACRYTGDSSLIVANFTSILSVVAMVPWKFPRLDSDEDWRYVVEKPGLDVARLGGEWDGTDIEEDSQI